MTSPVEAVVIGAGNRGAETYARWALEHPDQLKLVAVAEPNDIRLERTAEAHRIPAERRFRDWETMLAQPRLARAAIIATPDQMHTAPALAALAAGYDVLLEKPMAHRLNDCVALVQAAEQSGRLLMICHVLRYTAFWQRVKAIVDSGRLGQIVTVSHRENVGAWHMAHSYVRGNWRNANIASPMILAKSCHDLDILYWVLGRPVTRLSSVGSLLHFRSENAPPGAPDFCVEGCPIEANCPFYAPAFYIDLNPFTKAFTYAPNPLLRAAAHLARHQRGLINTLAKIVPPLRTLTEYSGWPRNVISETPSDEASLWEALRSGPYGRCVYKCDNDVVDHQIVTMELEGGISVSLTMHGHSFEEGRTIRIDGSRGTLLGKFGHNKVYLEIHDHRTVESERIDFAHLSETDGHGGGDAGLMEAFTGVLRGAAEQPLTSARDALESHLLAFAAEQARVDGSVIDMAAYRAQADHLSAPGQ